MRTKDTTELSSEELIKSFEEDPVKFIEIFLDRTLSPKQATFLRATQKRKHVLAIWSRQTGKSTVIASYIIWRLLYGKGIMINNEHMNEQIAIVAPIKEQLKNLYNKLKTLVDKSEFIGQFVTKFNTETICMVNGNKANFFSGSPGTHIRGYTATCIVIDESQDITDNKYSADILPFGATTNALIIEAGTPKTKNHFYKTLMSKNVAVIKQPWFECPFLSEEYVMQQKELSPDSLWRQEYLCEFVEEGVLAFPSKLFEPEVGLYQKPTGRWNLADYEYIKEAKELTKDKVIELAAAIKEGATFTSGLDLGRQQDNTVFTVWRTDIRPIRAEVLIKFPLGTEYTEIANIIGMFYTAYQPQEFNFDYTNEKSFAETLMNAGVPVVFDQKHIRGAIPFNSRNKSEMVNTAQVLLQRFQLQIPKSAEELISQFLNQQYEVNERTKMYQYFHPTGENDDSLWSTLLALKNITLFSKDEIVKFVNPWEKLNERIHGEKKGEAAKEVLSATMESRMYDRKTKRPNRERFIDSSFRRLR